MYLLLDAVPTLAYFGLQRLGVGVSFISLIASVLAAAVIFGKRRKGWSQDPVFLGCNIHFLLAGPLLWALFLSGFDTVAEPLLKYVLVGVPIAVMAVFFVRARHGMGPWALVGLAGIGVLIALTHPQSQIWAISIPLMVILFGRIVLSRMG